MSNLMTSPVHKDIRTHAKFDKDHATFEKVYGGTIVFGRGRVNSGSYGRIYLPANTIFNWETGKTANIIIMWQSPLSSASAKPMERLVYPNYYIRAYHISRVYTDDLKNWLLLTLPDGSFILFYSQKRGGKSIFQKIKYHVWHAYLRINRWLTDRNIVKPKYTPKK